MSNDYALEKPSSFSCPECGGVLRRADVGGIRCFRCHIGHVLTAEAVLAAQFDVLEMKLGGCLALLNERAELCSEMAADALKRGQNAQMFVDASREALDRTECLKTLLQSEWIQPAVPGAG